MMPVVEVNAFRPQNQPNVSTISLTRLVDFTIQRTYNELSILADLLPRKSDIERKIEIVNFANRTRQLFVRLLALVKWASNASKVEKCSTIVGFLDKQAMLFIETADVLAKMARESLVQARLPSLQLPAAVEVLTLGTYSRLPLCIKDRILPRDPITPSERKSTLERLNQIIQQRLVISNLSPQMKNFKVEHGRVIFHVNREFEMSLTLMSDNSSTPWRVLSIDFLVEDKETGEGKDLVHPLQINYLQNLIQSRLNDNSKSLSDPYNVLHSFCLSLQLEVLQAQALRLIRERLGDLIKVEEYIPGRRLSLSYWRHQDDPRVDQNGDIRQPCKLTIEIDGQNISKPLQVLHVPDLTPDGVTFANEAIKSDYLSIEKLLIHTTHERAKQELSELQEQLKGMHFDNSTLTGSPPVLQISVLDDSLPSEKLLLTVDPFNGHIQGYVPHFEDTPLIEELQAVLKKNVQKWPQFFEKLKVMISRERIRKTCELLPVCVLERLPFLSPFDNEILQDPSTTKLFIQFSRHTKNHLLVTISTSADNKGTQKPEFRYFMLTIHASPLENLDNHPHYETDLPKVYAKLESLIELDMQSIIGSNRLSGMCSRKNTNVSVLGKRKIGDDEIGYKRQKLNGFFIPEIAFLVNFCEEKLVLGALSAELQKRGICHHIRSGDEPGYTHYVDIIQYPPDNFGPPSKLRSNLTSCLIRLQGKGTCKIWQVVLTFHSTPQLCHALRDTNIRKMVQLFYDYSSGSQAQIVQMVNDLYSDWTAISNLYDVVSEFVEQASLDNYLTSIEIKSFTYKRILIGYGPYKNFLLTIVWKSAEKRFGLQFGLSGGTIANSNPHNIVSFQIQHEFNRHRSIGQLLQTLNNTLSPLLTLQGLTSIPILGVINNRLQIPLQSFCVVPQSSTHVRLIYREKFCLDILLTPDGFVAIRDGAFSLFDRAKAVENFNPIQGLKGFLGKFVDRNATQMRRLSQTEDDNPPSPIPHMDPNESCLYTQNPQAPSPITNVQASSDPSILPAPGTPGQAIPSGPGMRNIRQNLVSHPNTPASPHNSVLSQNNYAASPNTSFPLASPPSHGGYQGPGSVGQIVLSPSIPNMGSHPEQSPAAMYGVNSPMNAMHAPSPSFLPIPSPSPQNTNIHSPASNFMSSSQNLPSHDHPVNSPYPPVGSNISMPSPASVPWPNSPSYKELQSLSRPSPRPHGGPSPGAVGHGTSPQMGASQHFHPNLPPGHPMAVSSARFLPQRSWAAAIPTLLTHQGFETMCKSNIPMETPPGQHALNTSLSQLEQFLGSIFMRKSIPRH